MGAFNDVVIVPVLAKLFGIYPKDPTYGRYLHPLSQIELDFEGRVDIVTRTRRVFFRKHNVSVSKLKGFSKSHIEAPPVGNASLQEVIQVEEGEDVSFTAAELARGRGRDWIVYKVYSSNTPEALAGKGRGHAIVFSHGMCDYGAKYIPHVDGVLAMGFQVLVPDLPTHGRSTGLHVYLDAPWELTEGIHALLTDVKRLSDDPPKKVFLSGSSLGGWTSLAYSMRYPEPPLPLAGLFLVAPLIGVAPNSMPSKPTYWAALGLRSFLGRLPFAPAIKGNVSDDPRVEAEFYADNMCYHGDLRIATGLSLLLGLNALIPSASVLNVPIRIVHGGKDRATDHSRSVLFIQAVINAGRAYDHTPDASCQIYEDYEHVMLKVGNDKEDDERRQVVLRDMEGWISERV